MTNVKGFDPETGSAPQDGRSDADRAAFQAASHVRIPTARGAAGSYTRETLDAAIEAAAGDGDGPVIPKFPGPRQPSDAYDAVVLGQPHAWAAF